MPFLLPIDSVIMCYGLEIRLAHPGIKSIIGFELSGTCPFEKLS
jgi:hypothetical protein